MPNSARIIDRLYMVIIALVIALAGVGLAFFISTHIANGETSCINDTLGDRNGITQADTRAHVAFAEAIARADTKTERIAAGDAYAHALVANQKARDDNPLGHC